MARKTRAIMDMIEARKVFSSVRRTVSNDCDERSISTAVVKLFGKGNQAPEVYRGDIREAIYEECLRVEYPYADTDTARMAAHEMALSNDKFDHGLPRRALRMSSRRLIRHMIEQERKAQTDQRYRLAHDGSR